MSQSHPIPVVPVTFLVPESARAPIEIELRHQALRMVVVQRDALVALDRFWERRGVYFLFGHATAPEQFTAYVGKAPSGLLSRVSNHVRSREEPWHRALLIASATPDGLDSAAIGWLEGRLYDLLDAAPAAILTNRNRPGDETLPAYDRQVLEQFVVPIAAVLRTLDCPPDTVDQAPPEPRRRTRATYEGSLTDLIDGGFLSVGTRLRSMRGAHEAVAIVALDGQLGVGEATFEAPSAAAEHVLGQKVNGWQFWGAPSGDGTLTPLSTLRTRLKSEGPRQALPAQVPVEPAVQASSTSPAAKKSPRRGETRIVHLVEAGLMPANGYLVSHLRGGGHQATYTSDGSIEYAGTTYQSPSAAAEVAVGHKINGWAFWHLDTDDGVITLADLRARYGARDR